MEWTLAIQILHYFWYRDAEITMYYSWELVMLVGGLSFQNLRLVTI